MTRAASGSSRMPAGARATGSCRWRWPGWPRSDIAGRSGRTANRATARVSRCPSTGRSWRLIAGRRAGRRAAGGRVAVPAAWARRRTAGPGARRGDRSPRRVCRSSPGGPVPVDVGALGASAAASRPAFAHAHRRLGRRRSDGDVRGPSRTPPSSAGWSSRGGGSRRRPARPGGAMAELSVPSASARTIVYKGLVIGSRLPDLYPDLREPLAARLRGLPPALRDEHPPGLAARPAVPLDRPQRRDQHGPRQPRAGPRSGRGRRRLRDRPRAPRGRPAAVRGRLRFAVARRGARAADDDRLGADARAPDRDPRGARAAPRPASARGHAATPDGRLPGAVGRARRRSSSPTAGTSACWSTGTGCARRRSR